MTVKKITHLHEQILKTTLEQPRYISPPRTPEERVLLNTQWCIVKCLQRIGVDVDWPIIKGYSRNIWSIEADMTAYAKRYSTGWSAGVKDLLESMKGVLSDEERRKLQKSQESMCVDEEAYVKSEVGRLYTHFTSQLESKVMDILEEMKFHKGKAYRPYSAEEVKKKQKAIGFEGSEASGTPG